MTPLALILVITSTFSHALWNFLGKRRSPSAGFFLMASFSAAVCLSPVLVYYRQALVLALPVVGGLLLATAVFQGIYYIGLAGAYRFGQLSVAYPLARALPALLVTLVSALLAIGKPVGPLGWLGVVTVVAGCLAIPLTSFRGWRLSNYANLCCAMALLAACGTTGYTIIDSEALRLLRAVPGIGIGPLEVALLFMVLETSAIAVVLGTYVLFNPGERAAFQLIRRQSWRYAALTGLIITATYGLVLAAMAYVTNISYLAAFRELSIPLGALLGITLQNEPAPAPKIIGIGVVLVGLLLVGLSS
jgi:drug/metabolite transporter (DMT)-like permease